MDDAGGRISSLGWQGSVPSLHMINYPVPSLPQEIENRLQGGDAVLGPGSHGITPDSRSDRMSDTVPSLQRPRDDVAALRHLRCNARSSCLHSPLMGTNAAADEDQVNCWCLETWR
uniref:Uncharacterized protein n=1 Tax=Coccidioides posadasii RMSCC 3488 TaxID=454284 RepID=A0A0J6FIP9_COCPO|nr:hypothetical protein CPAG_05038 [Coccidioides posadasii RMSCC 3488]